MLFVDSHCHLDRLDLSGHHNSVADVISGARIAGIETVLCVAVDETNTPECLALAEEHELSSSAGIHPLSVHDNSNFEKIVEYAGHSRVVAIGETGLDYHYNPETAELQQRMFASHILLAADVAKPLIVHTREARSDTIRLLKDTSSKVTGVIHCFTEDMGTAKAFLDLGFYISFSGIITFRNADELREVVSYVPLDRMLIETDSPYLTPVPLRGKPNYPENVVHVAECVAKIKNIDISVVAAQTAQNYYDLFRGAYGKV